MRATRSTAISWLLAALILAPALSAGAAPPLRYSAQGKFKIVQFTDIHWNREREKDQKTLEILRSVLDAEKPDLVVLTGDIVTVKHDPKEAWTSVTAPIASQGIPWAAVLGNHDDENIGISRRDLVKLLATLPGSLVQEGPESLGGTGNYILELEGTHSRGPAAILYFLDSHAYPTIEAIKNCKELRSKYGWISFDQIQWYRQSSRKFRADNHGQSVPALAFFHIPLPEYNHPILMKTAIGTRREKEGVECGAVNTGMFAALLEEGDVMAALVGHDHDNDYAGALFGVCLAYGRVSGAAAYGALPRGARVVELTEGQRTFESWIRSGDGTVASRFAFPAAFQPARPVESKAKR